MHAKVLLKETWLSVVDWHEPINENMSLNEMVSRAPLTGKYSYSPMPKEHSRCERTDLAHLFRCVPTSLWGSLLHQSSLASRSHVEPLQAIGTEARLELMAAVLGVKLSQVVGQAPGIKKDDWPFWSDSMDVIYWFRGHRRRFKPFLANLVGEFQTLTNTEQWRHLSTKDDPTDLLTRGLSASALKEEEG